MKFRIRWQSKFNGNSGYGTGLFPQEQAEHIAASLNKQSDAICIHWAEIVKELRSKGKDDSKTDIE